MLGPLWVVLRFPFWITVGIISIGLLNILPYIHWLVLGGLILWIYKSKKKEIKPVNVKVLSDS